MLSLLNKKRANIKELLSFEKRELREVEKACARLFSSDDGRIVLSYLQASTFAKVAQPDTLQNHMFFSEGQRALVASILRLIERGRQNL